MPDKDERATTRFLAFWSSLPGVLTGIAGVLAAVTTLAALFVGGGDGQGGHASAPGDGAARTAAAAARPGDDSCLGRYFAGVPSDRVRRVEAGATNTDVIGESQPKAGTIGLRLTQSDRAIGAMRFDYLRESRLFKIESVVDAHCRPVEDYENLAGEDKRSLADSGTVRLRLAGGFFDLTTIAWGSAIRISFVPVVP